MSWNNLPTELRNHILNYIVEDCLASVNEINCPALAPYTTVSREWQNIFETITFQNVSLVIREDDNLNEFARCTSGDNARRRDRIRNISVIIVLPGYQCPDCQFPESQEEIDRNNFVFTQAMQALLGVLSTWTPNRHPDGLTLELNIKSSSDNDHYFDNHTMYDHYPLKHWNWSHRYHDITRGRVENRCCGVVTVWSNDQLVDEGCQALERYLGSLLDFTNVRLPRAEVVTSFLQRLQFKRQLSPIALRKLMQESLVQLSSLRLERWYRPTTTGERTYLRHFKNYFLPYLPKSLQVFQYYAERPTGLNLRPRGEVMPLCTFDLLSVRGHCFKEISVVEPAKEFVSLKCLAYMASACYSKQLITPTWHMLERVCFNTNLFYLYDYPGRLRIGPCEKLLSLSAGMAEMMPNLRSWEIYSVRFPDAGRLFRFSVGPSSSASILWKYWWPQIMTKRKPGFTFSPEVKRAWDKVAIRRTGNNITCLVDENESKLGPHESFFENQSHRNLYDDYSFELEPVHPFTGHLEYCWSRDQLLDGVLDSWD